jgi:hypothetical protein
VLKPLCPATDPIAEPTTTILQHQRKNGGNRCSIVLETLTLVFGLGISAAIDFHNSKA